MRHFRIGMLVTLGLAVIAAPLITRADEPTITVLTRDFYPLSFSGESDSKIEGIGTELVREILEQAGLSYQIRSLPWSRALQRHAETPNVLIYPIARTDARESRFHWIAPITPLKVSLYRVSANTGINPTSIEEARSYRVGTLRGGMVRDYLDMNGFDNLIEINSTSQHLLMAERNRYDLFPFVDFSIDGVAMRESVDPARFTRVLPLPGLSPMLSISLSSQTDPELVDTIRAAYVVVRDSGRLDDLTAPLATSTGN